MDYEEERLQEQKKWCRDRGYPECIAQTVLDVRDDVDREILEVLVARAKQADDLFLRTTHTRRVMPVY